MAEITFDINAVYLFVNGFILLFAVLDTVGNIPIFLSLTNDIRDKRRKVVTDSVTIAFIILIIFAYVGWAVFDFLGITINDFRIAGGIILFIIAFQSLIGRTSIVKPEAEDIAAFPLATPLLAGPGAISTVIIISSWSYGLFIVIPVITFNCLLAWIILDKSELLYHIMGSSGTRVMTRIMGLLIAAIAVSFIREGIEATVTEFLKPR